MDNFQPPRPVSHFRSFVDKWSRISISFASDCYPCLVTFGTLVSAGLVLVGAMRSAERRPGSLELVVMGESYFYETKGPGFDHVDFGARTGTEFGMGSGEGRAVSCFHDVVEGGDGLACWR